MFYGIKTAVFFGAHTDDEVICAGALHRLVRSGIKVQTICIGTAAIEKDRIGGPESNDVTCPEFFTSMNRIGVEMGDRYLYSASFYPSRDLHTYRERICQVIYDRVEELKPDLAFVLSPDDENPAHRVVGEECERVMRGRVPVVVRCQFPWNYSIGRANLFVKLDPEDVQCKRDVINCYQSQLWRYDYEDMLLSYARADGLSVKVEYAEKFELLRGVV